MTAFESKLIRDHSIKVSIVSEYSKNSRNDNHIIENVSFCSTSDRAESFLQVFHGVYDAYIVFSRPYKRSSDKQNMHLRGCSKNFDVFLPTEKNKHPKLKPVECRIFTPGPELDS